MTVLRSGKAGLAMTDDRRTGRGRTVVPSPAYLRTAGTLAPEPVLLPSLSHLTILPALQLREVRVSKVLVFFLSFDQSPRRLCWLARLRFSKTLSTYRTGRILRTED